jgi:hypothetical protein
MNSGICGHQPYCFTRAGFSAAWTRGGLSWASRSCAAWSSCCWSCCWHCCASAAVLPNANCRGGASGSAAAVSAWPAAGVPSPFPAVSCASPSEPQPARGNTSSAASASGVAMLRIDCIRPSPLYSSGLRPCTGAVNGGLHAKAVPGATGAPGARARPGSGARRRWSARRSGRWMPRAPRARPRPAPGAGAPARPRRRTR